MTKNISPPKDWDRSGLPGWAYFSQELFDLDVQRSLKPIGNLFAM